jgi:hypothetical protein
MHTTDILIYLGNLEQIQFKLLVKVYGESGEVVYAGSFDEQVFCQFSSMVYQKSVPNSTDDSLHLSKINYTGTTLKVVIEFGIANSSMSKAATKSRPPESLVVLLGRACNPYVTSSSLKSLISV